MVIMNINTNIAFDMLTFNSLCGYKLFGLLIFSSPNIIMFLKVFKSLHTSLTCSYVYEQNQFIIFNISSKTLLEQMILKSFVCI